MRISDAGMALIAEFEGFSATPYNDPAGHCTIGIGHLLHRGHCTSTELSSHPLEYTDAVAMLQNDVRRYEDAVNRLITVQLNQNQFDALVSFTFNLGYGALERSTLRTVLNAGRYNLVCEQLRLWNKAAVDGVLMELEGLTRRREAECTLWGTPVVPIERRNDLLTREYDILKEEIRIERERISFVAVITKGIGAAIKLYGKILVELVKRTGGPGEQ